MSSNEGQDKEDGGRKHKSAPRRDEQRNSDKSTLLLCFVTTPGRAVAKEVEMQPLFPHHRDEA